MDELMKIEQRMLEIENIDTSTLTFQQQLDIIEEYQILWENTIKH